jgi:hypothetical protein
MLPKVAAHLKKYNIEMVLFCSSWFITLFSSVLPFNYVLRIFDIFFVEKWKIIYRVALQILRIKSDKLLKMETFEEILMHLIRFEDILPAQEDEFFTQTI